MPSPSGRSWWSAATIKLVLDEEAYATGVLYVNRWVCENRRKVRLRPREEWIGIPVPPIVDPAVAAAVRRRRQEANSPKWNPRRGVQREWLLQGMLRCVCGRLYSPKSYTRKKAGRTYTVAIYDCTGHSARPGQRRRGSCPSSQISKGIIEGRVWEVVKDLVTVPEVVLRAPAAEEARKALEEELRLASRELEALEGAWRKLWKAYAGDVIDEETFGREARQITSQRRALGRHVGDLRQRLEVLRSQDEKRGELAGRLRRLREGLERMDHGARRRLVRQLFDEIVIDTVRNRLVFKGCVVGEAAIREEAGPLPVTFAVPLEVAVAR